MIQPFPASPEKYFLLERHVCNARITRREVIQLLTHIARHEWYHTRDLTGLSQVLASVERITREGLEHLRET